MKKLKKLWIAPLLLLIACLALAAWDVPGPVSAFSVIQTTGGGGAAPPDGPNTWYQSEEDGNMGGSASIGANTQTWGADITVATGGSATKVGVHFATGPTSGTDIKCGLYLWNATNSNWDLVYCQAATIGAGAPSGWNDFTLSTPQTITSGTYAVICVNDDNAVAISRNTSTNGIWYNTGSYSGACYDPHVNTADTNYGYGVRVYVD